LADVSSSRAILPALSLSTLSPGKNLPGHYGQQNLSAYAAATLANI
jgi:hypothetical protein